MLKSRFFMLPRPIGIISGAGPFAGSFLLERLLVLSNKKYGCYKDSDYPKIFLISFPFTEMLSPTINAHKLRNELTDCLRQLRNAGASVLAIACNTLHAFLNKEDYLDDLVHLPSMLANQIPPCSEKPLVFCTSTSVFDCLKDIDVSKAYPAMQYIEGYYLIRRSVERALSNGHQKVQIAFILPNDEGKYYLDYPQNIEKMLRMDFGERLSNKDINIYFQFFKYGGDMNDRPYINRQRHALKVSSDDIHFYFNYLFEQPCFGMFLRDVIHDLNGFYGR